MILQKNNIKLRALEPEDIELLYIWENNTEIWEVSNTITPFSKYIITKYVESSHLDIFEAKQLRLMIDLIGSTSDLTIGTIDLFDFDPINNRAGIGLLINDKVNRNKGYASISLKILIEYCFFTLNLNQLYCNISVDNKDSISLFKNNGFEITGEKKAWRKKGSYWINEYFLQLINPKY